MEYIERKGAEAKDFLKELGSLRIRVFKEYPYLYDGNLAYEEKYLQTYFACPSSYVIFCKLPGKNGKIVGASTGVPLQDADPEFQKPFLDKQWDLSKVFYYGESVLDPEYRGQGIGKKFMSAREAYAKKLPGITHCSFCAVVREPDHPLKPKDYQDLHGFWQAIGYKPIPGMVGYYKWKDINGSEETSKPMQFWQKQI